MRERNEKRTKMGAKIVEICIRESVCAYTVSQSGGGAGKKVKEEKEGKSGLESLFIYSAGRHGRHF